MNSPFFKKIKRAALVQGFNTMRKLGKTPPPKAVIWECTRSCNLACVHCGSADQNVARDELSTAEIAGIIRDLAHLGVMRFLITGGEPLIRSDLCEVLEMAKEYGMETGLSTNGSLISGENIKRIARVTDSAQVSVDGTEGTHDTIRGMAGAYYGAMNALSLLRAHGCRQVCMTSIITPRNIHELDDLCMTAKTSADLWRVGTVMPVGRASENDSLFLSDSQLQLLLDFLSEKIKDRFPVIIGENLGYLGAFYDQQIYRDDFFFCGIGIISCCIGADGRVRGCPELPPAEENIMGDLREERFNDIWEKGFLPYREERFSHLAPGCRDCTDLESCRGGCCVMQLKGMECTKKRVERSHT
jgi:radical SAM protein with 4Fe4S-binding SPASM domain